MIEERIKVTHSSGCEQSDKINVEKVMSRVNGKECKAIGRTTEELDKGGK